VPGTAPAADRPASSLPPEAVATLQAIERGGPFPYDRDGITFQNRERRLPDRPRGYYREYTVPTPGSRDRGARRIISGGDPPEVYYYTDDHYRTFRTAELPR
jgi:guanyl-specific ribonuclease Sa